MLFSAIPTLSDRIYWEFLLFPAFSPYFSKSLVAADAFRPDRCCGTRPAIEKPRCRPGKAQPPPGKKSRASHHQLTQRGKIRLAARSGQQRQVGALGQLFRQRQRFAQMASTLFELGGWAVPRNRPYSPG